MWQLETQFFASSYVWLPYVFEAIYSAMVMLVSRKSSIDQKIRARDIGGVSLSERAICTFPC